MNVTATPLYPRLISLDTSTLGALARDHWSLKESVQNAPRKFLSFLQTNALLPFLTFHHIEEILQHKDIHVVEERLLFIKQLPVIAWSKSYMRPHRIGGVIDLQSFELAAITEGISDVQEIISEARNQSLIYGPGEELITTHFEEWVSIIRPWVLSYSKRKREVASISHAHPRLIGKPKGTMADIRAGRIRSLDEVKPLLQRMVARFEAELRMAGDRKLDDPSATANNFYNSLIEDHRRLIQAGINPIIERMKSVGIDPDSISPETTVEEISEAIMLRSMLNVVAEKAGISREHLTKPGVQLPPTLLIWSELTKIMASQARASGSDITDRYLACYSLYSDFLQVDKRLQEFFRQLRSKKQSIGRLSCTVFTAPTYEKIPQAISALARK